MYKTNWFKHSVIYHILIDRFFNDTTSLKYSNKPIFLGGNLRGIKEKIPYLKNLGVDTIWISPFYKTSAYHGYHITDFYEVDPHFGTKEDLIELINSIHDNDMHVIADFVPNHCSKLHPFFQEAQENKYSNYRKWFYFQKWPDKYLCFLHFPELPKINLDYPPARKHIIDAALYWLKFDLDGYRLDHVIGPSHKFWKIFTKEIRKEFPNAILIGEAWMEGIKFSDLKTIKMSGRYFKKFLGASSDSLLRSYIGILDGVLDFRGQQIIKEHICKNGDTLRALKELNRHYEKYPEDYLLPLFLDNHDMNRILYECENNKDRLMKAIRIQFSVDQPVIIYYGTERGMTQDKPIWSEKSHGDLLARQPMQWEKKDEEIFRLYQELIEKRKSSYETIW